MNTHLICRIRGRTMDRRTGRLSRARRLILAFLAVVMLFGAIGTAAVTNVGPQAVQDAVVDAGSRAVKDALVQEAEANSIIIGGSTAPLCEWLYNGVIHGYHTWFCIKKDYTTGTGWISGPLYNTGLASHTHEECAFSLRTWTAYNCYMVPGRTSHYY